MSQREKRKKLKKFKAAYPDIFVKRFPTPQDEPDLLKSMSSLTRFKSVMRIWEVFLQLQILTRQVFFGAIKPHEMKIRDNC